MRVRALLAVALALRVATHGGGDRVVIAQDVLTRSTLGAEEKSLVGIAIGEVVSLGLAGLAASVLEGTAPVRLSTHLVVGGIWMGVAACACLMPACSMHPLNLTRSAEYDAHKYVVDARTLLADIAARRGDWVSARVDIDAARIVAGIARRIDDEAVRQRFEDYAAAVIPA